MQVTHAPVTGTDNPSFPVSKTVYEAPHDITGAPLSVDITVTNAELLALDGAPKTLVAAPGANKLIMPTKAAAKFVYGSSGFSTSDSDPTLGYGTAGWNPFNGSIFVASQFEDAVTVDFDFRSNSPSPPGEVLNKALVLAAVGTLTGGVGCSLRIHIEYTIVDWS